MTYYADYKIVDGMYFVRGTTPKGTVVSYGKTSVIALNNLMQKYLYRHKEKAFFRLGNKTEDPLEIDVTVRRTHITEWWFRHREGKDVYTPQPMVEDKESEYIYEVEDGVLKVYRLTLEKSYKIKQMPQVDVQSTFKLPDNKPTYPQGMPGYPQVMLNSNKGEDDVA